MDKEYKNKTCIFIIKRGSEGNTRLLPHAKMLLRFQWIFSVTGRSCSGEKRFDWANLFFADYFILRGRDTHIDFLRLLCLVGIWFALWCKSIFFDLFWNVNLFNAAKLRVLGCLISPKCLLDGSFENEALENEDRSTKNPKLENEAPKTRKRRPLNLENEAP